MSQLNVSIGADLPEADFGPGIGFACPTSALPVTEHDRQKYESAFAELATARFSSASESSTPLYIPHAYGR